MFCSRELFTSKKNRIKMFFPSCFFFACGALRLNIDDIMIANPDLNTFGNYEDIPEVIFLSKNNPKLTQKTRD